MGGDNGDGELGSRLFEGQLSVEELSRVRRQLTAWARTAGLDPNTTDAITLSGYEAHANTVEHAYREQGHGPVEVRPARSCPSTPPWSRTGRSTSPRSPVRPSP